MKFQIGARSFTDTDNEIISVSGSSGQIPGLNEVNISLELDFDDILPRDIQMCCLVASHDTATPVKLFSGFYLGINGDPIENNRKVKYSIKTVGILFPLEKGKPISNYNETKTVLQHAVALITQAGFSCNVSDYRYLEVDDLSGGGDSFLYKVDSSITNLLQALGDIASKSDPPLELHANDPGWLDIPTLFASNDPIVELNFRSQGSTQNPAPITSLVYDPTDPELCDKFIEPPHFAFDFSGITSIEVDGKFAEFAKEEGETVNTSYSKYLIYPIANAVDDPLITNPEFSQDLPPTINKLNQVLLGYPSNFTQIFETAPYDPNTPVSAGHFYFDKSVPRIILNVEDVNALDPANHNSLLVLANFLNLKVRRDNGDAVTALTSATGGAITHLYTQLQDQSIDNFTQAANVGDSILAREVPAKFTVSNIKRETTTEKWQVGQYFNFQMPAQDINFNVTVDSFSFDHLGKKEESGVNRDLLLYNITAKNISKNGLVNNTSLLGASRFGGGGKNTNSNNPSLPTYEEIPFGETCSYNVITTFAGTGVSGFSGDTGLAVAAKLNTPTKAIKMGTDIYICDSLNGRIRKVDASGIITTYAGGGSTYNFDIDGHDALQYESFELEDIASYGGELYFTDSSFATVGKIDGSGIYHLIHAFTTGEIPIGLAIDQTTGDIYICDIARHVIWKLVAGSPTVYAGILDDFGYIGEGAKTTVKLNAPLAITLDATGNIYFTEVENHTVRKIDKTTGETSLIAGTPSTAGYSGDGGLATSAALNNPSGVALDHLGNIYVVDSSNNRIRKIDKTTGNIDTFAGTGSPGYSGDGGAPLSAELNLSDNYGGMIDIGADDHIIFADQKNHRMRRIACVGSGVGACPDLTGLYALTSATTNGSHADRFVLGDQVLITPHALFTDADERSLNLTTQAIYTIDLTSPALVGHVVTLASSIYLEIAANANKTYSGTMKINGTTILSINETLGTGSFTDNFTVSINTDLSAFIGSTITVQFDTELTSDVIESIPPGGVSLADTLMTSLGQCTLNC